MKQIWIPKTGAPSVLEVRETSDPEPGPGQVRVRVQAAGVNFADLMARVGLYPDAPPLPAVVGYEVAGVIDAVGEGVDASRVGEEVAVATKFGGYSDMVVVDEVQIANRRGLDPVLAASLPVVGLTAWMMLIEMGRVREGDRVLVHSAGGGVGVMALDILKWKGAYAIGTASAGKHAFLKERGYDQLIDYRTEDFREVLRNEEPLDLILDPIGGDSWTKGLDLLRGGGQLICFGMSATSSSDTRSLLSVAQAFWQVPWRRVNPISLMNENKGVLGVNMGHMFDERARLAGWLQEIFDLVEKGVIRPHVHATVPFSQAAEAHRILHDRENLGKVVLVPDDA
ncbi:MAG: zinc-binding dehydrogenase [Proteobacteria bacterium]|nr:zinc-binding dehydrogenase [Pseudomonadota bacterium]